VVVLDEYKEAVMTEGGRKGDSEGTRIQTPRFCRSEGEKIDEPE